MNNNKQKGKLEYNRDISLNKCPRCEKELDVEVESSKMVHLRCTHCEFSDSIVPESFW